MTTQRQGYALARAELIHALTAYTGITTADGAVTRDTLIDANLIGSNDYITEKTIIIQSGPANNEDKAAISFNPATGQINVDSAFSAQIMAGTIFRILNISTVELDIVNILTRIGTNTDPAGTTTLFAWFAKVWAGLLGSQGLYYQGIVTAAAAPSFTIASLAGLGAGKFSDATAPYWAFVVRSAGGAGALPQGQMRVITAYDTATGQFTAAAFGAAVAVGDEVLILHPRLAEIAQILVLATTIDTKIGTPIVDLSTDLANALATLSALIGVPVVDLATDLATLSALIGVPVVDLATDIAAIEAKLDHADHGLVALEALLAAILEDTETTLEAKLDAAAHSFQEQASVAVNVNADNVGETTVFDLSVAGTRYLVRSLRLTCGVDPVAQTVTVRLYELINLALILVDSFDITTANWATAHSLMDMFGLPQLAGDNLKVTVIATAVGPYSITGRYSFATAT